MNGFLLVASYSMDDAPIGFLTARGSACLWAGIMTGGNQEILRRWAEHVLGRDIGSELISLGVVEFRGGIPQPIEIIWEGV